jgi:hypothetical protein
MVNNIKDIVDEIYVEVGGIFGVIAWAVGWPRNHGLRIPGVELELEVRIGRLRRLVESLHGAIN